MFIGPHTGGLVEPLTGRKLSAAEIQSEVERRVSGYRRHAVARGDRVLIGFGNRLEFFTDLLALWRLGACVIPLDARLTAFEIATLARAGVPWGETGGAQTVFYFWTSDGLEVATVSSPGLPKAMAPGSAFTRVAAAHAEGTAEIFAR